MNAKSTFVYCDLDNEVKLTEEDKKKLFDLRVTQQYLQGEYPATINPELAIGGPEEALALAGWDRTIDEIHEIYKKYWVRKEE